MVAIRRRGFVVRGMMGVRVVELWESSGDISGREGGRRGIAYIVEARSEVVTWVDMLAND